MRAINAGEKNADLHNAGNTLRRSLLTRKTPLFFFQSRAQKG
jgi:hypothetical protein